MGLLRLIVFLKSGLGIFLVCGILIMCCLPECLIDFFAFIMALGIIGFIIYYFISLFKSL